MDNRLITGQLAEQLAKYPLYSQDGLGKAAMCIGILELANIKWYVLEGQQEGNDYTLFTIVAGLAETEYGYTSANELASIQVDGSKYGLGTLQIGFKPIALSSISDSRVKQFLSRFED